MQQFSRSDLSFSLCGLNCSLCTMKLGGHCPGCGGGAGNQGCGIARCSVSKGAPAYCFLCEAYPCGKYDGVDAYDSFITHRNQKKDMARAQAMGLPAYHEMLEEKARILRYLLDTCNDGRRKTLFSLAVNLMELSDLRTIMDEIAAVPPGDVALPERAQRAAGYLERMASQKGITLKLNRKPPRKG